MIDWKKKLTSRKFWMAIVGFVTPLLLAFGVAEAEVTHKVLERSELTRNLTLIITVCHSKAFTDDSADYTAYDTGIGI